MIKIITYNEIISPGTCIIFYKKLSCGVFHDMNSPISTGKEVRSVLLPLISLQHVPVSIITLGYMSLLCNRFFFSQLASIYHATTFDADGQELAIKVYKTSVVVLKYVQGTLFGLILNLTCSS